MYSVRTVFEWSLFSSACFSWHKKNWEKYEGALGFSAYFLKITQYGHLPGRVSPPEVYIETFPPEKIGDMAKTSCKHLPSELILAPLSRKSWLPIWTGKTRS